MKITPALTSKEWNAALRRRDYGYFAETEEVSDHGKAALYLYEKPFGFTPDDVAMLEEVYSELKRQNLPLAVRSESLRQRIEALLPLEGE